MSSSFSFGSYCPGSSPLHRADPRAKLACGVALLVISLLAQGFAGLAVIAVAIALLYAVARVPLGRALRSLAPLLALVALVAVLQLLTNQTGAELLRWGVLRVTEGGVRTGLFTACRLALMMCGMSLVTLTTTTIDLTAGLERLLSPLARVGVPAHEIGMVLGIALRFMPQLAGEMSAIYRAQVSRGAALSGGVGRGLRMLPSVAVPLFASVFRHAETLSQAMEARCYHGEEGRTRLKPLRLGRVDLALALATTALLVGVLAANAVTTL